MVEGQIEKKKQVNGGIEKIQMRKKIEETEENNEKTPKNERV